MLFHGVTTDCLARNEADREGRQKSRARGKWDMSDLMLNLDLPGQPGKGKFERKWADMIQIAVSKRKQLEILEL